jgi:hypothetical protein
MLCPWCLTEFEPSYKDGYFCSSPCYNSFLTTKDKIKDDKDELEKLYELGYRYVLPIKYDKSVMSIIEKPWHRSFFSRSQLIDMIQSINLAEAEKYTASQNLGSGWGYCRIKYIDDNLQNQELTLTSEYQIMAFINRYLSEDLSGFFYIHCELNSYFGLDRGD